MVNNMVHGTYTETYDLNTAIGELSMLAIHTPQAPAVKKMFKGFFQNYTKYKILGCNFRMVCASQQALDPSQIGLESGQVDPRDVLNPILFKACTGESINTLIDCIYNRTMDVDTSTENDRSVGQIVTNNQNAKDAYYQLLADDSWRKSHPQAGLTVMGLKPMVHKIVSTQPFKWTGYDSGTGEHGLPSIGPASLTSNVPGGTESNSGFGGPVSKDYANASLVGNQQVFISNGLTEMPWLETTVDRSKNYFNGSAATQKNGKWEINNIPRVYLGALVLPPALLQRLFFRLQITWHIMFKDFRPAYEVGPLKDATSPYGFIDTETGIVSNATTYFNMYHNATPSKVVVNEHSSFTTTEETEVEVLNEKVA